MFEKEFKEAAALLEQLVATEKQRLKIEIANAGVADVEITRRRARDEKLDALAIEIAGYVKAAAAPAPVVRTHYSADNITPRDLLRSGFCTVCGCDNDHPCVRQDPPGGIPLACSWANRDHTLCTTCAELLDVTATEPIDLGASAAPAPPVQLGGLVGRLAQLAVIASVLREADRACVPGYFTLSIDNVTEISDRILIGLGLHSRPQFVEAATALESLRGTTSEVSRG